MPSTAPQNATEPARVTVGSLPRYWVSLPTWMGMSAAQCARLEAHLAEQGMELGIDATGAHLSEQADYQKDFDEDCETAGGPGA